MGQREAVMPLTEYEQKVQQEVEKFFRSPEEGPLGRISRVLFKPVELAKPLLDFAKERGLWVFFSDWKWDQYTAQEQLGLQRLLVCLLPALPVASEIRAVPPRFVICVSIRSRSFSKLASTSPSSERPRGSG